MIRPAHVRWGLGGLLAFEAILLGFTAMIGAYTFAVTAFAALGALSWALWDYRRTGVVPRAAMAVVAVAALGRALMQTAVGGVWPLGILPTYLVPVGFALLMLPRASPGFAVALIAAARSWFVVYYFVQGPPWLVVANLVAAAGAWAWWAGETFPQRAAPAGEDAAGQ